MNIQRCLLKKKKSGDQSIYQKKSKKTLMRQKTFNFFVESFFSSNCAFTQWVEEDRLEKKETTAAAFCSWIEEAFVNSFFDWIKGKIISRTSDKARTLFEMTCPADNVKGALHIDVSVFKGFPLPAYAFCMYIFILKNMKNRETIIDFDILSFYFFSSL